MIPIFISVEYKGFVRMFERSAGVPASNRMLSRVKTFANRETVLFWHTHFLPSHFTARQTRYPNKSRKRPYSRIKRELGRHGKAKVNGQTIYERVQLGGEIDAVRKGKTAQMAKAASAVRASGTGATLFMSVPRYAALRPKDPTKPILANEITRTTSDERAQMRRQWTKVFVIGLRNQRDVIRKRLS